MRGMRANACATHLRVEAHAADGGVVAQHDVEVEDHFLGEEVGPVAVVLGDHDRLPPQVEDGRARVPAKRMAALRAGTGVSSCVLQAHAQKAVQGRRVRASVPVVGAIEVEGAQHVDPLVLREDPPPQAAICA